MPREQTTYSNTLKLCRAPKVTLRAPKVPLDPPTGPKGAPGSSQGSRRGPGFRPKGPEGPPGGALGPPGALGPEALRAGGLEQHGLAITRSALDRHGLSKGCGLAVPSEAVRG